MHANRTFVAGNPLPYDSTVKEWKYWVANITEEPKPNSPLPDAEPVSGAAKDTTHIAIIDRAGNIFDSTPSGGWIPGAVILGDTGIGMSIRGDQFWLDETRAAQLRPRSRPRYTLTPSIVGRNGQPFMALGTPGGDNQDQTIEQRPHRRCIANVLLCKNVTRFCRLRDGFKARGIGQIVNIYDESFSVIEQESNDGGADKSGASSHKDCRALQTHRK